MEKRYPFQREPLRLAGKRGRESCCCLTVVATTERWKISAGIRPASALVVVEMQEKEAGETTDKFGEGPGEGVAGIVAVRPTDCRSNEVKKAT